MPHRPFSSCSKQGYSEVAVSGFLVAVASLIVEHGLSGLWLQQLWLGGSRAQTRELWCMGLVVLQHVGSSQTRDGTYVSCISKQILQH